MQVAIANAAGATFRAMEGDAQQWRRDRLRALSKKLGGNAPLGRALGYRDGAFVSQMLSGLRPITEKTVAAAEKLPGARGWFARETAAPAPRPGKGVVFEELSAEEKAFLEDFRAILDSDRVRIIEDVARRADELREYLAQHGSAEIPLVAKPRHAAAARRSGGEQRARLPAERDDDKTQQRLPLEPTRR